MVSLDEDALICDLAETYGVYDYRSLPANLVATFAVGLREDSRIKIKLNGMKRPFEDYMLAAIYDGINWLCWSKTKNGANGVNMPARILDQFFDDRKDSKASDDFIVFDSPAAFEKAWAELAGEDYE